MEEYLSLLHWSFFALALLIAVITEFLKKLLKLLPQNKVVKVLTPSRLIPAILGGIGGVIPGIPAPEMVGGEEAGLGHVLYFATAGIVSAWVYSIVQKMFEEVLPDGITNVIKNKLKKVSKDDEEDNEDFSK